jgi:tetratricopeptide (TPR) repeat protein
MTLQERHDDAMFDFSRGDYASAIAKLRAILAEEPGHFDSQLALGMAHYRLGDYAAAIAEGHKAEKLRPKDQLVHTNLSLFYMKAGNRAVAEHHGLQARIAGWREDPHAEAQKNQNPDLQMAKPKPPPPPPAKFPEMPWKKKPPAAGGTAP